MKKSTCKSISILVVALTLTTLWPLQVKADEDDPPARVARLSFARGAVSFDPAGTEEWVDAVVNRPITTGDKLWADQGGRAELQLGPASIRLSEHTGFSLLDLSDRVTQIRLTEGTARIRVKRLEENETFEIDTPTLAFTVLRPGIYRLNVSEGGDSTVVRVLGEGSGEATGGGAAYAIHGNQVGTFTGTERLNADIKNLRRGGDEFDSWCAARDRRTDHSRSIRNVSDDVVGYEDLDEFGSWRRVPEYGNVWFPRALDVTWAPYRHGHWVWISPWGWTWVDDAPWGFAPFHYGRWVAVGGVWGWVPCPPRPRTAGISYVRPVYAPALVAWVDGPHVIAGAAVPGGGNIGWFPLGPHEVYIPSYHASRAYVNVVNISNTTVDSKVVNDNYNNIVVNKRVGATNVKYVNQGVPGAVTATSHATFSSAQSVGRNLVTMDQSDAKVAAVNLALPNIAPQQKSILGAGARTKVKPSASSQNRAVVVKKAPPPPPMSFEKQQSAIQSNGGRPLAISQTRQLPPDGGPQTPPNIKIAPPAQVQGPDAKTNRSGIDDEQLDEQHRAQRQQLQQKQASERNRLEDRQEQEQRKLRDRKTSDRRQLQERQQRELDQLQEKHRLQQETLSQQQQQERLKQTRRARPTPTKERPPSS